MSIEKMGDEFMRKYGSKPVKRKHRKRTASSNKGWTGESSRHALARMGVKTGNKSKNKVMKENRSYKNLVEQKSKLLKSIDMLKEENQNKTLLDEKKDLVKNYDEFTTSDLQGVVSVLARKYGVDEDELLTEIIIAHNYATPKLRNEYLEGKARGLDYNGKKMMTLADFTARNKKEVIKKRQLANKGIWVTQGNYGSGWEDVTEDDNKYDGLQMLKDYNNNEKQYPHRLIKRRK